MSLEHLTDDEDRSEIANLAREVSEVASDLQEATTRALAKARRPETGTQAIELLLIEQVHAAVRDLDQLGFLSALIDQV